MVCSMYAMLGVQIFKGGLYSCYDLENQVYLGTAFNQVRLLPDALPVAHARH